jgi:hypothetical protein
MIKIIIFLGIVVGLSVTLYLIGTKILKLTKKDFSETLEDDIEKGEKIKQTIKNINQKWNQNKS